MPNYRVTIKYSKLKPNGELDQREYTELHSCDTPEFAQEYALDDLHGKEPDCAVDDVHVEELSSGN